jgi:GH35 family endo-1,4-beta-xylanase
VFLKFEKLENRWLLSGGTGLLAEYWTGIGGAQVSDLTGTADYPELPSGAEHLSEFETPGNFGDNYGTRVRGYLHPPVTGRYELYIASDDHSELWLSTDKDPANARRTAFVPGWTSPRQWDKFASEQMATVDLIAGQSYYVEALHKEDFQADHLAVGWKPPGASAIDVIPGIALSPVLPTVRLYVDQSVTSEWTGAAAELTVVRDTDLGRDLAVQYALGGTAVNGDDYVALSGTVTIPAGQRTATFGIEPLDDAVLEGPESVTVTLADDPAYLLATPSSRTGEVTLYDDDHLPPGTDSLYAETPADFGFFGSSYGSRSIVSVAGMPFTEASRIVTATRPPNDWDIRIMTQLLAPVSAGDTLLLTFWARNGDPAQSAAQVRAVYERAASPWTKSLSTTQTLAGQDWQRIDLPFRAAESYDGTVQKAQLFFSAGFDAQTVEIGGVELTNYGPTVSPEDLNTTAQTYQGRSGLETGWRDDAQARIEQDRMADLTVEVVDAAGNPVSGALVQARLMEHAFGFGSAVAASGISNSDPVDGPTYRGVIAENFNKVVLENDLKWPGWQNNPTRAIDAIDWLYANGVDDIRGHNLIWPSWRYIPASPGNSYGGINYRSDPNKDDSQEEYEAHVAVDGQAAADGWLRQRVLDHIAEEAGHGQVQGRLRDWDVVNEPYTNHQVQDILTQAFGGDPRDYLTEWFQAAKAADPAARLFLNDYPSLAGGSHLDAYYDTLQYMIAQGAPLEGIGIQGHFGGGTPGMDAMLANLDRFAAFGLPLQITEFDQTSLDLQLQADFLRDFMTLSFSHSAIDAFVMWGFWEGRHWKPDAALWRDDWSIKPNGQQWLDLVRAEWQTDTSGSTFDDGILRTHGYLGSYEVVVSAHGQTFVLTPELLAGGTNVTVTLDSEVVGRHVFYNNSKWDGHVGFTKGDPAANAFDDGAIATDKTALLPGQTGTFANYTSYPRGINGIMVDIQGLADPVAVADGDLSEFDFKYGNDDTPDDWSATPAPLEVTVRDIGGGVHRVTFIWADNAIPNKNWVQVTVKSHPNTGLAADDVFYFGNTVGENTGDFRVDYSDAFDIIWPLLGTPLAIGPDHVADINRDGRIDYSDVFDDLWPNLSGPAPLKPIHPPALPVAPLQSTDSVFEEGHSWAMEMIWFDKLYGGSGNSEEDDPLEATAVDGVFSVYYSE